MKFEKMVKDKKILLLGPAPHIVSKKTTDGWQEFDIIVKLNKMSTNTFFEDDRLNCINDVLYHCLDINESLGDKPYSIPAFIQKKVKHIRIAPPALNYYFSKNIKRFLNLNNDKIEYSIIENETFIKLQKECNNTLPNTGTTAIYDLLCSKPKILSIKGITFFKNGYDKDYKEKYSKEEEIKSLYKKSQHDIGAQISFFKNLYNQNKDVIKIDKELENAIR